MIVFLSVLIGLLSMVTFGTSNALSKPLSKMVGPSQIIFLRSLISVIILSVICIFTYKSLGSWQVILSAFALGLVGYLPVLAFTHGIKESPLGIIAPIAGSAPLITVILSFLFLGLALDVPQWVAIILIIVANIAVSVDVRNWRQSNFLKLSSGIPFALIAAFGWGIYSFILIPISQELGPWQSALLAELGVTIAAGLHIKLSSKKFNMHYIMNTKVIVNALLVFVGVVSFKVGVSNFNVGIVAALSGSTALVSMLIGMRHFGERLKLKDRVSALVMILSVAALSLF